MKKREKKTKFDYKIFMETAINPFRQNLVIKAYEMESKDYRPDKDDHMLHPKILIEDEPITKLYTQSKLREVVSKLSPCATKLFNYIAYELEANKQVIWINKAFFMKEFHVSLNTYKKALIEVQRANILISIAGYKNWYWFNPQLMWSGNRIKTFPENLIIKKQPE